MRSSHTKCGSKGQILLHYFYKVKGTGSEASEEQSKTFITDTVIAQKETVPLHLNTKQAQQEIKTIHTLPPKHSHLSHLKSYSEQKWYSKKSLLTDTVPEVLRCCLTVVIPPHLTPNHVLHRECPRYLAAFPWLVSKCWGPSALLCKMFPPEDHSLLQTELLRSLHTLELPLKLTGKGNKAFRFTKQNRKINPSETVTPRLPRFNTLTRIWIC